jgi:hypothetical protein
MPCHHRRSPVGDIIEKIPTGEPSSDEPRRVGVEGGEHAGLSETGIVNPA